MLPEGPLYISLDEFHHTHQHEYRHRLLQSVLHKEVFIYPTDTIYGLWGVLSPHVIERIYTLKRRPAHKSFSLLAPSLLRIAIQRSDMLPWSTIEHKADNFLTWLQELMTIHGPLTTLFPKPLNSPWVSPGAKIPLYPKTVRNSLSPTAYVGIRYLCDHPMQSFAQHVGRPLISTSANISGHPVIQKTSDLPEEWSDAVPHMVFDPARETRTTSGRIQWSTLVYYPSGKVQPRNA